MRCLLVSLTCLVFLMAFNVSTVNSEVPGLIKDLNLRPNSATGLEMVSSGNLLYFRGTDPEHGFELWVSDGSASGTFMLKDLSPGSRSSTPNNFTPATINAVPMVFFVASDLENGTELWRTDGTVEGTFAIDVNPGGKSSFPSAILPFAGLVLFMAQTENHGREVWVTDGTQAGTFEVKDLNPGAGNGVAAQGKFGVVPGGAALFAGSNGNDFELWRTDGSDGGTQLVSNISSVGGSAPSQFLTMPGLSRVVFAAFPNFQTIGLYSSDGFGVNLLKTFPFISNAGNLADFAAISNTRFVFTAHTEAEGREPWVSDGTPAGTNLLADITAGDGSTFSSRDGDHRLIESNGFAIFTSDLPSENPKSGLFVTDGTTAGTQSLSSDAATFNFVPNVRVGGTLNNRLYFRARSRTAGTELFSTDGSSTGTGVHSDIVPGLLSSFPIGFTSFNGELYFMAQSTDDSGIFRITAQGVTSLLVSLDLAGSKDSLPLLASVSNSLVLGKKLFFSATDGDLGSELFVTDGTSSETKMVKDINLGSESSFPRNFIAYAGGAVFEAFTEDEGRELWFSDGTEAGTRLIKDIKPGRQSSLGSQTERFVVGNFLLFPADDGVLGTELWRSDGTVQGTSIVKDIGLAAADGFRKFASPPSASVFNDILYFGGDDSPVSNINRELWRSDGTSSGTFKVKEIDPSPTAGSEPSEFVTLSAQNIVLFAASDGVLGLELFKTDGTADGTALVKDIYPNDTSSFPNQIQVIGSQALFSATTPDAGEELWVTDGSAEGTQLLKDINPGINSSQIDARGIFKNLYFFQANDGVHGRELWVSDGTTDGTRLLKDANPGSGDGITSLSNFTVTDEAVFYRVIISNPDQSQLRKLFVTDGTPEGTNEILLDGSEFLGSGPLAFRGQLIMGLSTPSVGIEPFSIVLDACPDDLAKIAPGACGCGTADTDIDVNGITDCLTNSAFKSLTEELAEQLNRLKAPKNKKKRKQAKILARQIKVTLKSVLSFAEGSQSILVVSPSVNLPKLLIDLKKSVSKAAKLRSKLFAKDKRLALKVLRQLQDAV